MILVTIFNGLVGLTLANHGIDETLEYFLIALLHSSHGSQHIQLLLGRSMSGFGSLSLMHSAAVPLAALACVVSVLDLRGVWHKAEKL